MGGLDCGVVGVETSAGFAAVAWSVTTLDDDEVLAAATGLPVYSIFCQQPASMKIGAIHKLFRIQYNMTEGGDGIRSKR
jgi:hypothetical protein